MGNPDLLVVGDCNPDLVLAGEGALAFGQVETLVDSGELVLGGSASIAACGAARLGLATALASLVGDDVFGRFQLSELDNAGVDTSRVQIDPRTPTGVSVVLRRSGGDRAILTALGAIGELRAKHVEPAVLAGARHVHVTPYFLLSSLQGDVPRLLQLARKAGATTSLDTNWDPRGRWGEAFAEVLGAVDTLLPNAEEAMRLTGLESAREAAARLAETVPTVAVKLGEAGGYARSGDEEASVKVGQVEVVDTTGAGDSFDAGFLAARLQGWDLQRSLRLACACGSLSVRTIGGTAGQPTMPEAQRAAGLLEP